MPIYMDLHIIPGVKAKDVAEAHLMDLMHQGEHACNCMTYWVDEKRGNVFCLIEAPSKEAVVELHGKAHGLVPSKIIEVNDGLVESFLGRISDPDDAVVTDKGLKVFSDASFRILMVTKTDDPVLLQHRHGKEKANDLLKRCGELLRKNIAAHNGREAAYSGEGFVASFASAAAAVECALAVQKTVADNELEAAGIKTGVHAGEPVEKNDQLFGGTILFAERIGSIAKQAQVAVSSSVKDLLPKDFFHHHEKLLTANSPQDEELIRLLFDKLDENWHDAEFGVPDYCRAMAMSQSQFYRKTVSLYGVSPNALLNDYRLEKAKSLMKQQRYNVSQVTFESGFSSPSYFTKCFKNRYGLLPMAYLGLLS